MSDAMVQDHSQWKALSRGLKVRALALAGIVALGIGAVKAVQVGMHATFTKPPAPLQQPLPMMSKQIGTPARYVSIAPDEIMEPEMVETLGTRDYLIRQYIDRSAPPDAPGAQVLLNLNYYATGSSTPHVPEICWAAGGMKEMGDSRAMFDVEGVKHRDGSTSTVRMRLISFVPREGLQKNDAGEVLCLNIGYMFQVNGEYVATPHEVMSKFWSAGNAYAYHTKIEISPVNSDGRALVCTRAEAKRAISNFVREALPAIEACLPDPEQLNRNDSSGLRK